MKVITVCASLNFKYEMIDTATTDDAVELLNRKLSLLNH